MECPWKQRAQGAAGHNTSMMFWQRAAVSRRRARKNGCFVLPKYHLGLPFPATHIGAASHFCGTWEAPPITRFFCLLEVQGVTHMHFADKMTPTISDSCD